MNNYVKPVIKLATFAPSGSSVSCGTTESDMELIQSIIGGANANDTFGMGESCQIELPLDMYCKFTSAEMGKIVVFWS
ncbi:MAG: hypothetical protein IKK63_05635 [Clostridia bacterium]|nr:hypothetical protein [Clostridia bacterium]MBR3817968.1 hypothetical protein [Clostridia bacterium]